MTFISRGLLAHLLALLFALPVSAQLPPPAEPFLYLESGTAKASGVCIASDGHKSLVLTNNHLFATQPGPGLPFPLAPYPMPTRVFSLDGKQCWQGTAVAGHLGGDLAVVVVEGNLPFASLAGQDAKVGEEVWHKGIGSGGSTGKVLKPYCVAPQCCCFTATLRAIPGDSGSGIFNGKGQVVAITCGRVALPIDAPLRGTPVSAVWAALGELKGAIPEGLLPK